MAQEDGPAGRIEIASGGAPGDVLVPCWANFLNGLGVDFPTTGNMTHQMIDWINKYTKPKQSRDLFFIVFQGIRSKRYAEIAKNPNQAQNLGGWLIRTWGQ